MPASAAVYGTYLLLIIEAGLGHKLNDSNRRTLGLVHQNGWLLCLSRSFELLPLLQHP